MDPSAGRSRPLKCTAHVSSNHDWRIDFFFFSFFSSPPPSSFFVAARSLRLASALTLLFSADTKVSACRNIALSTLSCVHRPGGRRAGGCGGFRGFRFFDFDDFDFCCASYLAFFFVYAFSSSSYFFVSAGVSLAPSAASIDVCWSECDRHPCTTCDPRPTTRCWASARARMQSL